MSICIYEKRENITEKYIYHILKNDVKNPDLCTVKEDIEVCIKKSLDTVIKKIYDISYFNIAKYMNNYLVYLTESIDVKKYSDMIFIKRKKGFKELKHEISRIIYKDFDEIHYTMLTSHTVFKINSQPNITHHTTVSDSLFTRRIHVKFYINGSFLYNNIRQYIDTDDALFIVKYVAEHGNVKLKNIISNNELIDISYINNCIDLQYNGNIFIENRCKKHITFNYYKNISIECIDKICDNTIVRNIIGKYIDDDEHLNRTKQSKLLLELIKNCLKMYLYTFYDEKSFSLYTIEDIQKMVNSQIDKKSFYYIFDNIDSDITQNIIEFIKNILFNNREIINTVFIYESYSKIFTALPEVSTTRYIDHQFIEDKDIFDQMFIKFPVTSKKNVVIKWINAKCNKSIFKIFLETFIRCNTKYYNLLKIHDVYLSDGYITVVMIFKEEDKCEI